VKITKQHLTQVIKEELEYVLKEEEPVTAEPDDAANEPAKISWDMDYVQFVKTLGANAADKKVRAFIAAGLKDTAGEADDMFTFGAANYYPVAKLRPTQSEIDVNKSLKFPMAEDPKGFIPYLKNPGGDYKIVDPIVIYNEEFVIDGHHRWSTVYCCDPTAKILAVNITTKTPLDPIDILKAMQASIAIQTKSVPTQSVEGANLFNMNDGQLKGWLNKTVKPEFLQLWADALGGIEQLNNRLIQLTGEKEKPNKNSINEIGSMEYAGLLASLSNYLWANISKLQTDSRPAEGAPVRNFMPQTDDVDYQEPLKAGHIDIADPHAAAVEEAVNESYNKMKKLAGLIG